MQPCLAATDNYFYKQINFTLSLKTFLRESIYRLWKFCCILCIPCGSYVVVSLLLLELKTSNSSSKSDDSPELFTALSAAIL